MRAAVGVGGLALVLAAAACGVVKVDGQGGGGDDDGDAITEDFVSGTRLKARYLDGGEGARAFLGWIDSSLAGGAGLPCSFFLLADGSHRCLPVSATIVYLDATCTSPVAVEDPCAPDGGLALRSNETECDPEPYVDAYAMGDEVKPSAVYQRTTDGGCELVELADGTVYRGLLGAITPDDYVAAEIVEEAREGRVTAYVRAASDGARELVGNLDTVMGGTCVPVEPIPGGPAYCIPFEGLAYQIPQLGKYQDASCSVDAAYRPKAIGRCSPPPLVMEYLEPTGEQCGYQIAMHLAGEELTSVYGGELCELVPLDTEPYDYYAVGEVVPITQFAPLSRATVGTGRLGVRVATSPEGQRLSAPVAFVDVTSGTEVVCQPYPFSDGATRCLPQDSITHLIGAGDEIYSDETCTRRVIAYFPGSCSTLPPYVLDVFQPPAPGCGGGVADVAQMRPVLAETLGVEASTFAKNGPAGECLPTVRDVTLELHPLGAPVDPGVALVPVNEYVDP